MARGEESQQRPRRGDGAVVTVRPGVSARQLSPTAAAQPGSCSSARQLSLSSSCGGLAELLQRPEQVDGANRLVRVANELGVQLLEALDVDATLLLVLVLPTEGGDRFKVAYGSRTMTYERQRGLTGDS